jgi:hypothetical protein
MEGGNATVQGDLARPDRNESGFPRHAGGASLKALIRRRAGQCMDRILVS